MSRNESMDLGGGGRRRGSAPKAGSVWESRMKLDQVKGGIKVFKAADENSAQNTQITASVGAAPDPEANAEIEICRNATPKQSPSAVSGKRKTWKSESFDGSPVKIAALRSELSRNSDEQINESSDAVKQSPLPIRKSSLRKVKFDSVEVKDDGKSAVPKASVDEKIEKSNSNDERERKSRSDEDCEKIGVCEEIKAAVTSILPQINGGDESDFEIEAENKSVDVKEIAVGDDKHKRVVIEEKKSVQRNKKSVPISSSIAREQPPPAANHARFQPTPTKINNSTSNSDNFPRRSSKLQSFVHLIMWRDVSKSAFVFGIGTFAIISSSYTKGLNISFISVLSYLGLVYLAAIFLFRSLISRGTVGANEDCVIGEEEASWVIKLLLPFINEFFLKLRALFSGDPSTTMKLAVLLFILARCGSSITIWTTAKLGFIGVFTVPKICSAYSSQITAYGTFWIRRFGEAWESCSHKKAVGFAVFALVWNLSSVVVRIWAVFMLFVAFKHYQQSLIEDEAINGQYSISSRQARTTSMHNSNTEKLKKAS